MCLKALSSLPATSVNPDENEEYDDDDFSFEENYLSNSVMEKPRSPIAQVLYSRWIENLKAK